MVARGPTHFVLTLKGSEELAMRTYRLDLKVRNILFLIQKGTPTIEAILQNSIFPREEVVEKLRGLLREQFVALGGGPSPAPAANATPSAPATLETPSGPGTLEIPAPDTIGAPPFARTATSSFPLLEAGVSVSQARFVLCDFCLDQFGVKSQPLIDAINGSVDVQELQQVLDSVTGEIRKHCQDQLPVLMTRVHEINQSSF
jgi:hypothetical protein